MNAKRESIMVSRETIERMAACTRRTLNIHGPLTLDILIQKLDLLGISCVAEENMTEDAYTTVVLSDGTLFEIHYASQRKEEHILFSVSVEFGKILLLYINRS